MSDTTEAEMSDFANQFVQKGTARTNMWAVKLNVFLTIFFNQKTYKKGISRKYR